MYLPSLLGRVSNAELRDDCKDDASLLYSNNFDSMSVSRRRASLRSTSHDCDIPLDFSSSTLNYPSDICSRTNKRSRVLVALDEPSLVFEEAS